MYAAKPIGLLLRAVGVRLIFNGVAVDALALTDSDCVGLCGLEMEVPGFLQQKDEFSRERIHPANVTLIFNEIGWEEGSKHGLQNRPRCSDANVVGMIAENIFRIQSGQRAPNDASLKFHLKNLQNEKPFPLTQSPA